MTRHEGISKLIAKAREDAAFFHQLVWKPEAVLASLDFLSREEKAALVALNPEDLVVNLVTGAARMCQVGTSTGCAASCDTSIGDDRVRRDQLHAEILTGLDTVRRFSRFRR